MAINRNENKNITVNSKSNSNFTYWVSLTFLFFSFIGIVNHEMWLDELQAWLIARDSSSVIDMFKNLEYEGHPGLWYLCLYIISRFTHNPISMQIFHIMLATVGIYVFTKFAPFTNLQKILFSFGYFPFYEYNIISRSYVLGILLSFLFCALFPRKNKSYLLLSCLLCLLANTSVYGLIIAITLGAGLIFDCILSEKLTRLWRLRKSDLIISFSIFSFGVLTSIIQIIPPRDASFSPNWITNLQINRLTEVFLVIAKGYIPIPNFFTYQFWNTSLFTIGTILTALGILFSLGLLIFALLIFSQKPIVFFLYISGISGMLAFMYFKYIGTLRHSGHLFILFIICLWLASYYTTEPIINSVERPTSIKKLANFFTNHDKQIIMAILYTHLFTGIFAFTMDLYYPFSITKEVASFIKNKQIDNILLVGDVDYINVVGPPLSGYLEEKVHYLGNQQSRFGSFLVWDKIRGNIKRKKTKMFFKNLENFIEVQNTKVLLVLPHKISSCKRGKQYQPSEKTRFKIEGFTNYCWQSKNYVISKVAVFKPGIVPDENPGVYLYTIRRK